MSLFRAIARLDIKGPNVVKSIHFEGLRKIGDPQALAEKYANEGADELFYNDQVASLYGRNQLEDLLERTTERVFIPVTVGGGISSLADVQRLLNAGADKVAVNTAAIRRPALLNEIAGRYGSQCLVVSIEAKRVAGGWECYTDCGRERTSVCAERWVADAVDRGAGEILVTSIDQDGTLKGFDNELLEIVSRDCPVPVTACGGLGTVGHARQAIESGADAIACASALHYNRVTFEELRHELTAEQFPHEGNQARRAEAGRSEGGVFGEGEGVDRREHGVPRTQAEVLERGR